MTKPEFFRTRLRNKGQITVPGEIRTILGAEEGDELVFLVDEKGKIIVDRIRMIPPDQVWFWSERWQQLEREVQDEIENNKIAHFDSAEATLKFLHKAAGETDAEDNND